VKSALSSSLPNGARENTESQPHLQAAINLSLWQRETERDFPRLLM